MNIASDILENYNGCKCSGGGEGGSSGGLIVNLSMSDGMPPVFTMDKTAGEIKQVINNGGSVIYKMTYPDSGFDAVEYYFATFYCNYDGDTEIGLYATVNIRGGDVGFSASTDSDYPVSTGVL